MDTTPGIEQNAWEKVPNNDRYCFKQILEGTSHKKAALQELRVYLINNPSKTNKTREALAEK